MWIALLVALLWAVVSTVLLVRMWRLYWPLLEYHDRFLARVEKVVEATNNYMRIPLFAETPEVRGWVLLVRSMHDTLVQEYNALDRANEEDRGE